MSETTTTDTANNYDPFDCAFDEIAIGHHRTFDASTAAAVEAAIEEEAVVAQGRRQGREAGLLEGFSEGRLLGQTTGVEYGMEIGFATGLLEAVRHAIASGDLAMPTSSSSLDRIVKSANDLEKAIRDFPACEEESIRKRLFRSKDDYHPIDDDKVDHDDEELQTTARSKEEDVRAKLQRIRARCKVLAAKLGIPHHSLKSILAGASQNTAVTTTASSPSLSKAGSKLPESGGGDQDW